MDQGNTLVFFFSARADRQRGRRAEHCIAALVTNIFDSVADIDYAQSNAGNQKNGGLNILLWQKVPCSNPREP